MNNVSFTPFFETPIMEVQLDLDLEKLTEFTFEMWNNDKKGVKQTNFGGWQSGGVIKEKHEEFIKLKKEITQHLQTFHSNFFREMKYKENVTPAIVDAWLNINEKYHYNEWHHHPMSTLSGVFYIKHDCSAENGDFVFKNPYSYATFHWPIGLVKDFNKITSCFINYIPKPNMLLIFPAWLEHKVEMNLKNDSRISLSFDSTIIPLNQLEKKSYYEETFRQYGKESESRKRTYEG